MLHKLLTHPIRVMNFADEGDIPNLDKEIEKAKQELEEKEEEEKSGSSSEKDVEIPQEYHKDPRWQKIYGDMKKYRQEAEEKERRIQELEEELAELEDMIEEIQQQGTREDRKVSATKKTSISPEFIQFLEERDIDVSSLTPQQLQTWSLIYEMVDNLTGKKLKSVEEKVEKVDKETLAEKTLSFHMREMEKAKKWIEENTDLDWNEVDKALQDYAKSNDYLFELGKKFGTFELMKSWLLEQPDVLSKFKKKGKEELLKLNEKKRQVMSETETLSPSAKTSKDYLAMSENEFIGEALKEASKLIPE